MKGFWDGSKVAVLRSAGTAMTAEVMGVCVLAESLDLVLNKSLSVQDMYRCIDTLLKNQ